ncbi:hypothetical protein MferCBS31731_001222 [Microsporum ferrugineum]
MRWSSRLSFIVLCVALLAIVVAGQQPSNRHARHRRQILSGGDSITNHSNDKLPLPTSDPKTDGNNKSSEVDGNKTTPPTSDKPTSTPTSTPDKPTDPTTSDMPTSTPPTSENKPTSTPTSEPNPPTSPPPSPTSTPTDTQPTPTDKPTSAAPTHTNDNPTNNQPTPKPTTTPKSTPTPTTIIIIQTYTNSDGSVGQSTISSVSTPPPEPTVGGGGNGGSSGGMSPTTRNTIIGVVVGVGGAIILGGLAIVFFRLRRKRNANADNDNDDLIQTGAAVGSQTHEAPGSSPFKSTLDQYHKPGPVNPASNF